MKIIFDLVEIGGCFFDSWIAFKIFGDILHKYEKREKQNKEIWIILGGMALTWLCNQNALFSFLTMFLFVLYVSLTGLFLYKTNFISLLSISSFYLLCMSCVEFFLLSVISSIFHGEQTMLELISVSGISRMMYIIFAKTIWLLIYFFVKKYLYIYAEKVNEGYSVLIISILGFIGVIFPIKQTFSAFNYNLTGIWFIFVLVVVFLLFASHYTAFRRESILKLDFEKKRNLLLEKEHKTINDIYQANAKLYHDMNNHLNVLYQLIQKEKNDSAKKYIEEIGRPVAEMANIIWTSENVIDAILNSKLYKMNEKNIEVDYNVEFPQGTNIKQHDMCTILANLLDNAIEAAEQVEAPRKVSLTIRKINYFLLIRVTNSCPKKQENIPLYPKTTKKNKEIHGWGLHNVMDVVEKYNGTMKCINENNTFTVSIMLCFVRNQYVK